MTRNLGSRSQAAKSVSPERKCRAFVREQRPNAANCASLRVGNASASRSFSAIRLPPVWETGLALTQVRHDLRRHVHLDLINITPSPAFARLVRRDDGVARLMGVA